MRVVGNSVLLGVTYEVVSVGTPIELRVPYAQIPISERHYCSDN
jgi:hypothetical protein